MKPKRFRKVVDESTIDWGDMDYSQGRYICMFFGLVYLTISVLVAWISVLFRIDVYGIGYKIFGILTIMGIFFITLYLIICLTTQEREVVFEEVK